MTELSLLLIFFKIGFIAYGGGYGAISVIQQELVITYGLLSSDEFLDIIALAQITPGPIALNAATFIGTKYFNPLIGVLASFSLVLGPFILIIFMIYYLNKLKNKFFIALFLSAIEKSVIILIGYSLLTLIKSAITSLSAILLCVLIIVATEKFKKIPIPLFIILSGLFGIIIKLFVNTQ